jgi:hypothetical protein
MPIQRRGSRRGLPQVAQFNPFDDQELGPQWRRLPPATRSTVTDLMVRLPSEHRRSDGPGTVGERHDD